MISLSSGTVPPSFCRTDPVTAECVTPLETFAGHATFGPNEQVTFSVFVRAVTSIPLAPHANRLTMDFYAVCDPGAGGCSPEFRASVSVALTTE